MPNSASDARNAEADIRQNIIEHNLISAMLTMPSNMFYTVTLPATLWFFDKNKADDKILFIDARNIFRQIDRAHRDFTNEQIQNIAMINKLHHRRRQEYISLIHGYFAQGMELLQATISDVAPVVAKLKQVAAEESALLTSLEQLDKHWQALAPLERSYLNNLNNHDITEDNNDVIDKMNAAQIALSQEFEPFLMQNLVKKLTRISGFNLLMIILNLI